MLTLDAGRIKRVQWNAVPYHKRRVVFLITPKCGNSAIKTALMQAQGEEDPRHVHKRTETWSPAEIAKSGYRGIAVVRNPYARAVSVWHEKIVRGSGGGVQKYAGVAFGQSFEEFLRAMQKVGERGNRHIRSQWVGMYHRGRFLADRVIRLEEPEGWEALRQDIPELPTLPVLNASNAPDWREVCRGEAQELILRRWGRDFDEFGYPRDLP
ncbi:sulfotransferase family 2 domain-containing protein [Halovulum sp. GXIMD14794]